MPKKAAGKRTTGLGRHLVSRGTFSPRILLRMAAYAGDGSGARQALGNHGLKTPRLGTSGDLTPMELEEEQVGR